MIWCLVAIDPGGESGIAWVILRAGARTPTHVQVRRAFARRSGAAVQVSGDPKEQVLQITEVLQDVIKKSGHGSQQTYKVRIVVACESFNTPSKHVKDSVMLAHTVGQMLDFYVWLLELPVEWRWQQPSEMGVVTDDQLRRWGLWQPGKRNDDAMAALKHLIVLGRKVRSES